MLNGEKLVQSRETLRSGGLNNNNEDVKTLIPVDSDIHGATKHTGGVKTTELKINNIFDYE